MSIALAKKVIKYIKGYLFFVILSLLLSLIQVACSLYLPVLTGRGVDLLVQGRTDFGTLLELIGRGLAVILTGFFAQYLCGMCNNHVTFGVIKDLRLRAFERLQSLPVAYMDSHKKGDVVSRIVADVDQFSDGLLLGFTQFFTGVATILGTLGFLLYLNPILALVVVCLTPISFLVAKTIAQKTHRRFLQQAAIKGEQTALIDELLTNSKVVKAYLQEENSCRRFNEINESLRECSQKAVFYSSLTNPSTRFVNSLVYMAVAVTGAVFVLKGRLTVGLLTSCLSYASQYTKPFNEISEVITELQNAMTCAGRVIELIEEEPERPDGENALAMETAEGAVSLKNVSFSYVEERPLIRDFNLEVKRGQRIAIVGPTGCGKTTLINLLMRFYDVNSGAIEVDGSDIRDIKRKSLRRSYGMVLQDTYLKSGSVLDNLRLGKPDASLEEVRQAAKAAHADSFIRRLPKGYDTVLKEDGQGLSQGEKQLLCIARLMLLRPPMLILDEATSSIDVRTEKKIQGAFATLMEGKTSFIVAHRLSTIKNADLILCMKEGHIVEWGSHSELMEKGGFYAGLYSSALQ